MTNKSNSLKQTVTITGIEAAIERAGGRRHLAEVLGVSVPAVSNWLAQGFAPPGHVPAIVEHTGVPGVHLMDPRIVALVQDGQ